MDAWRLAYARMAADAIGSVDPPLEEEDEHTICTESCVEYGGTEPCRCDEGSIATPACRDHGDTQDILYPLD